MKKLCRRGAIHPSPPTISDHLSFLPAAILTLASTLSPEDREVLAYLISSSASNTVHNNMTRNLSSSSSPLRKSTTPSTPKTVGRRKIGNDHPPLFYCDCFRCYLSYWVRWDSSPNRHLIHEIIDAFEDSLLAQRNHMGNNKNNRKDRKRKVTNVGPDQGSSKSSDKSGGDQSDSPKDRKSCGDCGGGDEEATEKGSVRRLVSFIGETLWGVLG
ncbi:hypothetical protein K2173_026040 [Erythroxylum novogranatense]|uniref:Uncharacterized protein n=1 Tax=Erythroxylum novogranatense TaxID=1862640 RepID=A0AAV8SI39_9ROSI|nr:hypothetical protein K2173_026040 [Erythroxylum novogranatense]